MNPYSIFYLYIKTSIEDFGAIGSEPMEYVVLIQIDHFVVFSPGFVENKFIEDKTLPMQMQANEFVLVYQTESFENAIAEYKSYLYFIQPHFYARQNNLIPSSCEEWKRKRKLINFI